VGSAMLAPAAHPAWVLLPPALLRARADVEISTPAALGKGTGHQ